jgi:hypothetical protein
MEEKSEIKVVSGLDILVAVVIILIGILVINFGFSYSDYIDTLFRASSSYSGSPNPYTWLSKSPMIILFIGLVVILYGIKRLIDDLLKIF